MRNLKLYMVICTVIFSLGIVTLSCNKENGTGGTNISTFHENESHYTGENCMNCHYRGGEGDGWFTAAGTVEGNYQNSIIIISTEPEGQGTVVDQIEVDQLGNFYTTDPIDFEQGLYASLKAANGDLEAMDGIIYTGACSMCHGFFEDHMRVEN